MSIRGILFDKDGTLIDFWDVRIYTVQRALPHLIKEFHLPVSEEELHAFLGIKDGKLADRGAFLSFGFTESFGALIDFIEEKTNNAYNRESLLTYFVKAYETEKRHCSVFKTFTDMPLLMKNLADREIKIGIATTDGYESTCNCMRHLGVLDKIDFISASDTKYPMKPNPTLVGAFAERFDLDLGDILVVGDTGLDVKMAREAKTRVAGVLKGIETKEFFESKADYVIESVDNLVELIDGI